MSSKAPTHDWKKLTEFMTGAPYTYTDDEMPVLIMGDVNAHNPLWDNSYPPSYYEPAGSRLSSFLSDDNDWHVLNLQMPELVPTRISSRPNQRDTVIDLGLCNHFNFVHQFEVNDYDLLVSDHKPIHAHLHTKATTCPAPPQRFIWKTSSPNIPWDIFQSLLTQLLSPWRQKWEPYLSHLVTFEQQHVDKCWNDLRHIIHHVATNVIGKKAVSATHKHWFTLDPAIPTLHRNFVIWRRKRALCRRNGEEVPDLIERQYQHTRYLFRTAMHQAKQACWEELVGQVAHDKRIVWTAWHGCVPSSTLSLPPFAAPGTPPARTPIDNLNIMGRHIQQVSTVPHDPAFNNTMDTEVEHIASSFSLPKQPITLPFTQQQLEEAAQDINTNTALGPDDISPHFIKHGGSAFTSCLYLMFRLCYQHGVLPTQWKEGTLVALYKNVGDKHDVNMYRPITIVSVIMRLFDRLMLPTLLRYMSEKGIPYDFQFGFTKLRSTYDAIMRLLSFVGRYYNYPIPAVFIDITKAYDRVWVKGLLYKLHTHLNMKPHDLFFYRALLTNRAFRVCGNGYMSDLFSTPDGVPQGGVSAPQLFITYIYDMCDAINSIYIKMNLYADDLVIWASELLLNNTMTTTFTHMQQALNKLTFWASTWKVAFSPAKTQLMIFSHAKSLPSSWAAFHLWLSGFVISRTDTYKYLGLVLQRRLEWKHHVQEIIHNATATSYHIARLASYHIRQRPPFKIIRQLVISVLIPKITYALPFIHLPYAQTHTVMRRMKRLIIYPLRRALGLPNNAHHDSIFIESRVLPIPYLQVYHSLLFARRYIKQANTSAEAASRHRDLFVPGSIRGLSLPSDPMNYIPLRCQMIPHRITSTPELLLAATSKQLWNIVFQRFYDTWFYAQHPLNPDPDPHSIFPCYMSSPTCSDTRIPLYLERLDPSLSSIVSRLRFNRSRLNQSLHKRAWVPTSECPTCRRNIPETVEHVVMHCPRYDHPRFDLLWDLSYMLKLPPLRPSFPFPFLLCSLPDSVPKSLHTRIIRRIASFLNKIRSMRDM